MRRAPDEQVLAALAGDTSALDGLIRAWLPQVVAWCARLGAPEPEEAALDVMMLLVRRRSAIAGPAHLPPWLFAACRGITANQRKRAWWRRWWPGTPAEPATVDGAIEQREVAARVAAALERLEAHQRELLVLCYFEEWPLDEAAVLLGVPVGTVKSRLFTARRRFEDVYRRNDG